MWLCGRFGCCPWWLRLEGEGGSRVDGKVGVENGTVWALVGVSSNCSRFREVLLLELGEHTFVRAEQTEAV